MIFVSNSHVSPRKDYEKRRDTKTTIVCNIIDDGGVSLVSNMPPKEFRITAKKFFLTWPRCDATKEVVRDMLLTKATTKGWIVCIEDHKDPDEHGGAGTHLHAVVEYTRKLNIKDPRAFDIGEFHAHIEACKNYSDARMYCMKDGDFIQSTVLPVFDVMNGHNYVKRKQDYLAQKADLEAMRAVPPVFPIVLPDGKTEWSPTNKKRGLWIVGAADSGKSTWFMNTFDTPNYQYFVANNQPYPFEGIAGQQVVFFDDNDPTLDDIKTCINVHGKCHPVGRTRHIKYYWKYNNREFYEVMIVLSNRVPVFENDDTFKARFDIIHV